MIGNQPIVVEDMFQTTDCPVDWALDTPTPTGNADFPYSPMCHECVVACTDCQAKLF